MEVEAKNISKYYGRRQVLRDISLAASSGDRVAVLGSNGAGKTTLLEILAGVIKPDQGALVYNGRAAKKFGRGLRRVIGFVPQELALFPKLTINEQLDFWAKVSPETPPAARVEELISLADLGAHTSKKMEQLSGGMKRKLNLIASLLHDPQLIIADEPTVGIDIQSKLEIIEFLKGVGRAGKIMFFSSHSVEEIELLATKVAYLDEGRLLFFGSLNEAFTQSRDDGYSQSPGWRAFAFLLNASSRRR